MDWGDIAWRLGAAALIGAAIGLDRELQHKSAGMRTIGLVALGAALAALTITGAVDATSRVLQGIMAGIGFLGAGVIIRHEGSVEGLTTAAAIWTAAVLGAVAGLGLWHPLIIGAAIALILLICARWVERRLLH